VLGARRADVIGALMIEFGLIGLVTSAVAAAIGTLAAYLLLRHYMHMDFVFLPAVVAVTALLAGVVIVVLGLGGTWHALGQKPAPLLRNA
jgi:putative ABC transport system permease protein